MVARSASVGPKSGLKRIAASQFNAGWSSPVARQAHNLKVTGSNPVPATKQPIDINVVLYLPLFGRRRSIL